MESLHNHNSPPFQPDWNYFSKLPSFNLGFRQSRKFPEIADESGGGKVYVAVGKSIQKSIGLLQWTFQKFGFQEIVLLHVHQPSSTIPTPLGKLPINHANEELVIAHQREEKKQCKELLFSYLNICSKAKVNAAIVMTESGQVEKGIVELVTKHASKKLVMGALLDINCMKATNSTTKAGYVSKIAPPFCEIWFVSKGKRVWTREASSDLCLVTPMHRPSEHGQEEWLRSNPSFDHKNERTVNPTFLRSDLYPNSGRVLNWLQGGTNQVRVALSADESSFLNGTSQSLTRPNNSTPASGFTSDEIKVLSQLDSKLDEETGYNQMLKARAEAVNGNDIAFAELLKRKKLEYEALEANNKVKAFEAAYADEVQLRKEVEDKVENTRQEQEHILKQIEDLSREWQTTMRNVSLLESHCIEANCRENEASRELKLIQMSVTTLQDETKNMCRQKEQAMQHLEWWRNHLQVRISNDVDFGFINTSAEYKHFSLFDLQIATCNFSESFIIGQGSYGCVYKGEISDRSVAIKKLNPFNMQDAPEFQQEVEGLSKLKHPRLVTLIGACPEACSLVYEYLPNGSIEDHLFRKTNNPLTWKKRTHIVADMSSALLYLHSCKPGKTIHGNLKPKNILLDPEFNCKIGDFMIGQLVPKKTARCPSFRGITEMESVFPYIDPELQTFQDLTPKSDIYALGVIILQLLTGRSPMGLASEVRRAVLCGNLMSVLDTSAGEWPTFVARRLVEFGLQCCELKGRDRPELKPALVMGLEKLHLAEGQPVPSFFLCPILQELMYDPHVAADGFTYEGEAIRGWLKGGRGTSPMTNLTLSHFSLTPNHALRSAIQDWLCHS